MMPHADIEGLGLLRAGDDDVVVVAQHHHRALFELGLGGLEPVLPVAPGQTLDGKGVIDNVAITTRPIASSTA